MMHFISYIEVEQNKETVNTYKYWRLFNWLREDGMKPENLLFERSKVWSLGRLPSSGGILPEMLLFCSKLHSNNKPKSEYSNGSFFPSEFRIAIC
jgi:hypothetical protein